MLERSAAVAAVEATSIQMPSAITLRTRGGSYCGPQFMGPHIFKYTLTNRGDFPDTGVLIIYFPPNTVNPY